MVKILGNSVVLLCSLDKLVATIYTILDSIFSSFSMFIFSTIFNGYVSIYYLATHRTGMHRSINTAVIKVLAPIILYHYLFDPLYTINWLSDVKKFVEVTHLVSACCYRVVPTTSIMGLVFI